MAANWTEDDFWDQFRNDRVNKKYEAIVQRILEQVKAWNILEWPKRGKYASFTAVAKSDGQPCKLFQVWAQAGLNSGGNGVEITYAHMKGMFASGTKGQRELEKRLEKAGFPRGGKERPNYSLINFDNEKQLAAFLAAMEWAVQEMDTAITVQQQPEQSRPVVSSEGSVAIGEVTIHISPSKMNGKQRLEKYTEDELTIDIGG